MMKNKDKLFWSVMIFIAICLTIFVVVLEVNVQKNWDRYEENVFIERNIR